MKRRHTPGARPAFTIVELLVAMALIVFIMYILAEAFAAGTTAFRNLKAIGDMNERLRSAGTTLRRYLEADHFEGRKRLSDLDFWKDGPPQEGFFRIIQTGSSVNEGNDLDGIPSFQSSFQALHFTVKLRGNNRGDYFRGSVPAGSPLLALPFADSRFQDSGGNVICSPAAEVVIYLRDTGLVTEDVDSGANSPQKLFTLQFRQRLLVPDNGAISPAVSYNTPANNWQNYMEVSATQDPMNTNNLYFNNLQDVTLPGRRWGKFQALSSPSPATPPFPIPTTDPGLVNFIGANAYPTLGDENAALSGNDILLTDVLSCQISFLLADSTYTSVGRTPEFVDIFDPVATAYSAGNKGIPANSALFDTWSSRRDEVYDYSTWDPRQFAASTATIPMLQHSINKDLIRIRAIKITMRIWDSRTKQTRQSSIVVDL